MDSTEILQSNVKKCIRQLMTNGLKTMGGYNIRNTKLGGSCCRFLRLIKIGGHLAIYHRPQCLNVCTEINVS